MYVPDPTEILESQMERQIDLVDENDTYPCHYCGKRFDMNLMHPVSSSPATPLMCYDCLDEEIDKANPNRKQDDPAKSMGGHTERILKRYGTKPITKGD